jgi:hypothetical protein
MSFWVEGWIEVSDSPEPAGIHAWSGVVNLGPLVDVADGDSERLFGLSKLCASGENVVEALAAKRGVPTNPSGSVRQDLDWIAAHESEHGPGDFGGYTHATWGEIRTFALTEAPRVSQ